MWNERQRTQKIGLELERVKRVLREQDATFEDLMREHFVTRRELEAAGAELEARDARPAHGTDPMPGSHVVWG